MTNTQHTRPALSAVRDAAELIRRDAANLGLSVEVDLATTVDRADVTVHGRRPGHDVVVEIHPTTQPRTVRFFVTEFVGNASVRVDSDRLPHIISAMGDHRDRAGFHAQRAVEHTLPGWAPTFD